jgi:uncharacterized protein YegL
MNWIKKMIGTCENALNECLGMHLSGIPSENQFTAPALFRAGAPFPLPLSIGPYLNAVVLDKSGSMEGDDFWPSRMEAAKKAAGVFAARRAQLSPNDRLAIIGFDTRAKVYLPWSSAGQNVLSALSRIRAEGGTELAEGLMAALRLILQALNSSYTPRVLLLTDGHGGEPVRLANQMKSQGILIQVIGIGGEPSDVNEEVLKAIATTDSNGFTHYWFINDSQNLVDQYEQLSTGIVLRR